MTTTPTRPRRIELRNIGWPQKLLVIVILMTVGFGYLGALANLFAQHAAADGDQTIELDDFASVYRSKGLGGLVSEISHSLGVQDVIDTYHGSPHVNLLQAALEGTMKDMILEYSFDGEDTSDEDRVYAEESRQMLIDWSNLDPVLREKAYDEGIIMDEETGSPKLDEFVALFGVDTPETIEQRKGIELQPMISETLENNCVICHSEGSDPQAQKMPLTDFHEVSIYFEVDEGIPLKQLALTTHVHLLGFSVLFAMTGFLLSLTSWPVAFRLIFVPWTLFFQVLEISFWWLAKLHVIFAWGIFILGPVIGIGLLIQIFGTFLDILIRRPDPDPS
ncbi:hypothetical protein Pan216_07330 [Planctomycetes bacterium Pan216]|uniref:Uncharacterized protein n=1 Tax=Kolteria novifilia TaxID=2527975 RepID=A0A518AYY9_9BACT|nr:hypothetical protein Pan216_07330 [Planctomycetes bacterium Pan216]